MTKERPSTLKRDVEYTWSPQRETLKPDLFRPANSSSSTTLDAQTSAEVQTQVSIYAGGFRGIEALIKTEGVSRYQYVKSSIGRRFKDFMKS